MNTLLVSPDVMVKLLKLPEFQNPLTGLNFQGTGKLSTPLAPTCCAPACCLKRRQWAWTSATLWSSFRAAM